MPRSHTLSSSLSLAILFSLQCVSVFSAATAGPGTVLFARQNPNCIQNCPVPTCDDCTSNQLCSITAQTCTQCSEATCLDSNSTNSSGGAGTSIGAIIGGTLGGVAFACIVGYFLWRKYGKKKQGRMSMAASAAEKENDFGMLKSARASTHTVASIASTVRTRASNVIQIAYIPGVTNRSTPSTPGHLVPPVPPLPHNDGTAGSQYQQSIQFSAEDILRQSVYTINDNRSSVATTIYGQSAVAQPVAANFVRAGKAAVVTVKGGNGPNSSPPTLFAAKGSATRIRSPLAESTTVDDDVPPSPAFSVGSTFLNRMNSTKKANSEATTTAPSSPQIRLVPGRSRAVHENHSTFSYDSSDSDEDIIPGQRSKRIQSQCSSCITDMDTGSPFSDHHSVSIDDLPPANAGAGPAGNSQRASLTVATGIKGSKVMPMERTVSPFDDSHSIDKVER